MTLFLFFVNKTFAIELLKHLRNKYRQSVPQFSVFSILTEEAKPLPFLDEIPFFGGGGGIIQGPKSKKDGSSRLYMFRSKSITHYRILYWLHHVVFI